MQAGHEHPSIYSGESYSLFSIKDEITPDQFLPQSGEANNVRQEGVATPTINPLIDDGILPLVLQEKKSGDIWAIDLGPTNVYFNDWQIYLVNTEGIKQPCTINFRPDVHPATTLLPKPVRKLADLLRDTMGKDANFGVDVETTWTNALLRPWALSVRIWTPPRLQALRF